MSTIREKYILDEYQENFENFVKKFGYTRRVESYFIIREDDGYINVHREFPSRQIYKFYKNFYQGTKNPFHDGSKLYLDVEFLGYDCVMTPDTIELYFNRFSDFKNFLCNYHTKQGRKLKLKQLHEKE
jgi:hypothetical protein